MKNLVLEGVKLLEAEEGRNFTIEYFITKKASRETDQTIYGVAVMKKEGLNAEMESVDNITYNYDEIKKISEGLRKFDVTPMGLVEATDMLVTAIICG
ncbi:hypothetical protein lbkm_0009 [Lachnospiraceae bacterium KM106-2]|nr:hypothetical protein lbkm_0009 [Lachnospiraceae bacterium KM106-2]